MSTRPPSVDRAFHPLLWLAVCTLAGACRAPRAAQLVEGAVADEKAEVQSAREREIAREKARLEGEQALAEAEIELLEAEHSRAAADAELATFREHERGLETAQAELALEKAREAAESARADLAGIRAIYAEETEARSKDEILRRHERALHFAELELVQEEARRRHLLEATLPQREQELERACAKAMAALDAARASLARAEREAGLALELLELEQAAESGEGE